MSQQWAGELFTRIAVPRLPGSPALPAVEEAIAERLRAFGYGVRRDEFRASPRRLSAATVAGAGLGWVTLIIVPLLLLPVPGWPVTLIGVGALGLVAVLAVGIAEGRLPVSSLEVPTANLRATRGEPALWLVAHVDSKAQGLSLLARAIAAVSAGAGVLGLLSLLVARLVTPLPWWAVVPVAAVALIGGAAFSRGTPRNDSPGAVDNATGVIAVLVAAERLRERTDVGVLLTGAEEFAMEGARAWVQAGPASGLFINFDGVDSRGRYRVVPHPPRREGSGAALSADLSGVLATVLSERGHPVKEGRLPFGVYVDGAVLAGAGMPGVTLCRGDWRTLRVVHTSQDTVGRVDVQAAVEAGEATAAAVRRLLG
ncbi:MAG: M28 family peptidase [Gemmatimonadales bacterium]|nr:M28 family peptidase [Gemmatimonadales bacterium]NIN11199.1 M28 family peptidase [Gemmatimonadales bacterium]NIN49798.1 M28 family peptidase [Gemmatimonadales bacterium]NIP07262.1 M28 family peptidase [Gemmatimonadales bacterium]NIR02957.1 M28 family peptidase [Gemmatimonadales bacterium]